MTDNYRFTSKHSKKVIAASQPETPRSSFVFNKLEQKPQACLQLSKLARPMNSKVMMVRIRLISSLFVLLSLTACGEFESALSTSAVNLSEEELIQQGKTLYAQSCASCHGPIDTSTKLGRTSGQINAALNDIPQMHSLRSSLDEDMVEAIAAALLHEANGGGIVLDEQGRMRFACTEGAISKTPLLKLTNREYRNAVRSILDIFGTTLKNDAQITTLMTNLPEDRITMDRNTRKESPQLTSQISTLGFFNVAYRAGELISASSMLANVPGTNSCLGQSSINQNCHLSFVQYLAPIAFRRVMTQNEISDLANKLYDSSLDKTEQVTATVAALLQWPDFQYKAFIYGTPEGSGVIALSSHELATRLAFFLTGAPPDTTLRQLANSGEILQSSELIRQTQRLLQTSLGRENLARFFRESYGYDSFDNFSFSTQYLAGISTSGLQQAMIQELDNYFTYLAIDQEATFAELFTSRYSQISHTGLRTIYGTNTTGAQQLATNRSGFLNRAAFLSRRSGQRTSPIQRGLDVLEHVLCVEVGAPPINAPTSLPNTSGQTLTTRAHTEAVSQVAGSTCVACHGRFNPLGYPFENFDTLGRYRTQETIYDGNGTAVTQLAVNPASSSTEIQAESVSFANSLELVRELGNSEKAQLCLAKHLKKFEARVNPNAGDNCQMNQALDGLQGDDQQAPSFQQALNKFITSPQFRYWSY